MGNRRLFYPVCFFREFGSSLRLFLFSLRVHVLLCGHTRLGVGLLAFLRSDSGPTASFVVSAQIARFVALDPVVEVSDQGTWKPLDFVSCVTVIDRRRGGGCPSGLPGTYIHPPRMFLMETRSEVTNFTNLCHHRWPKCYLFFSLFPLACNPAEPVCIPK